MESKKTLSNRKTKHAESRLLAVYGSIRPRKRPEDFRELREEFERGVAEEVMSETREPVDGRE